jgi:hypothetical protein
MASQLARITKSMTPRQAQVVERLSNRVNRLVKNKSAAAAKAPLLINGSAFAAGMVDEAVPFSVNVFGMDFTGSEVAALLALGTAVMKGDADLAVMASGVTAVTSYKAGKKTASTLLNGASLQTMIGL